MPTVKVIASGRAAHAGNHHQEGANAICALAEFILRLQEAPGVTFLSVAGGSSRNTVPDAAELTMTCSEAVLATLDLTSSVPNTTLSVEPIAP
jgi:glutamate carboxypeptidase